MSSQNSNPIGRRFGVTIFIGILLISLISCTLTPSSSSSNVSLQQTQMELGIQQTLMAQQAAQNAENQQQEQAQQEELDIQATQTQVALDNLAAQQAIQATETSIAATLTAQQEQPQAEQPQEEPQEEQTTSEEPSQEPIGDLDSMMDSAKILLYEDMVNRPATRRYVKDALDNMGLDYKDDGSAKGWLKSDLLSSTWDLVILALEVRSNVSGEYFTYVNQALDAGSAVILEIWYMDRISRGELSKTLSRCGVEFEANYVNKTGTLNDYINWPLPGKSDHPIFNDPNSNIRFTNVAVYWFGDLGDFMKLSGKKDDAELLMGTIATEKNSHGTLAVCNGGKFIIQTHSSHDFAMEEIVPLWENMITYALKSFFMSSQ